MKEPNIKICSNPHCGRMETVKAVAKDEFIVIARDSTFKCLICKALDGLEIDLPEDPSE